MKLSKLTSGLTAAALLFSSVSASIEAAPSIAASTSFKDVKSSDWYYSSIQKLISEGLVNGFEDGTFKPNKEISRAEFLKLVDVSLQLDIPANTSGKPWYTPYVNAAVEAGIHNTSDFNGNWTQPISRQEMARITVRAVDQTLRNTKTTDTQLVYEATKRGILSGLTGGELGLKENSTRAQATVIVDRVLTVLNGGNLTADKRAASYAEEAYRGTNVESMWGGSINPLPITASFSPRISGKISKVLVIDPKDNKSPYLNLVKGELVKEDRTSISNDYLVALQVDLENKNPVPNSKNVSYFNEMVSPPYMTYVWLFKNQSSPLSNKAFIELGQSTSKTVWVLYAINKSKLTEYKINNYPFFYFIWYSNNRTNIDIAHEGKVFSQEA